ncbi:hypothetical protein CDEF62S_02287 [Castellaniella defragrans]
MPNTALAVSRPRRMYGLVYHVIVQQGGRVDEFRHGRQAVMIDALIAQRIGHQQHHGGAHALAAGPHDVITNGTNQDDVGIQARADHGIDRLHVEKRWERTVREKFKTDPDADGRPPNAAAKTQIILSVSYSGEPCGCPCRNAGVDGSRAGRPRSDRGLAAASTSSHRLDGPRVPLAAARRPGLAGCRPPHGPHSPARSAAHRSAESRHRTQHAGFPQRQAGQQRAHDRRPRHGQKLAGPGHARRPRQPGPAAHRDR